MGWTNVFDDLEGQVAVITGGARGLGLSMAQALARWGVKIGLLVMRLSPATSQPMPMRCDLKIGLPGRCVGGATAVQHQGALFSRVDDRISVRVAAADPSVTRGEPARP